MYSPDISKIPPSISTYFVVRPAFGIHIVSPKVTCILKDNWKCQSPPHDLFVFSEESDKFRKIAASILHNARDEVKEPAAFQK